MQAQEILDRLALLRQRFQQAKEPTDAVASGEHDNQLLDTALRPLSLAEEGALPVRLSHRARRLLKEGRELLSSLRCLADEPFLSLERKDALARLYHETAAMLDTSIRTIQAFPASAIAQARFCDGLEGVIGAVADRLDIVKVSLEIRKKETRMISTLAELLTMLSAGELTTIQDFLPIANELLEQAHSNKPLRFLYMEPADPARFVAAHSLTVAQVVARLIDGDAEYRGRAMEPVLAALIYDVGMLEVPGEILCSTTALADPQRRELERHTLRGAEILRQLGPGGNWLAEPALKHHERLDGSGYSAGLPAEEIPSLVRLLAVADVYAALASPRPHRPALEPRTALTDVLVLADRGVLDRTAAEKLLNLSFYPVGTMVELADGAIGIVVAVNKPDATFLDPSRPVVAVVREDGSPVAMPTYVNLRHVKDRSIVRSLDTAERSLMLGKTHPALV